MPLTLCFVGGGAADTGVLDAVARALRPRGVSLTTRILAVNVIALAMLAGSFFYLDSYRNQLVAERFGLARAEAQITASALAQLGPRKRRLLVAQIGVQQKLRLRLYDSDGDLVAFAIRKEKFTSAIDIAMHYDNISFLIIIKNAYRSTILIETLQFRKICAIHKNTTRIALST